MQKYFIILYNIHSVCTRKLMKTRFEFGLFSFHGVINLRSYSYCLHMRACYKIINIHSVREKGLIHMPPNVYNMYPRRFIHVMVVRHGFAPAFNTHNYRSAIRNKDAKRRTQIYCT